MVWINVRDGNQESCGQEKRSRLARVPPLGRGVWCVPGGASMLVCVRCVPSGAVRVSLQMCQKSQSKQVDDTVVVVVVVVVVVRRLAVWSLSSPAGRRHPCGF